MSLSLQFQTLFAMVAMGLVVGMNLDFYHRLTIRMVKSLWTRAVWDVLFWLVQALLVFYVLLRINEGELRIYLFFAILTGFFIYIKFGRHAFLSMMEKGFSFARWGISTTAAIFRVLVVTPVKFILKLGTSSVMIGLTIISNVLLFLLNLLLFPLKPIARLFITIMKRFLPQSFLTLMKKAFYFLRERVKGWRIFK